MRITLTSCKWVGSKFPGYWYWPDFQDDKI